MTLLSVLKISRLINAVLISICLCIACVPASAQQDTVEQKGHWLIRQGYRHHNQTTLQQGYGMLGEFYLRHDDYSRARQYLDSSWNIWQRMGKRLSEGSNYKEVYRMYNAMGILAANVEMDYARATSLLCEGLELALRNDNDRNYAALAYNLVVIFFIREDLQGRQYAQSIYERGVETNDNYVITLGATGMALMAALEGDYPKVEEWLSKATLQEFCNSYSIVPALRGIAAAGLNRIHEAELHFRQALQLEENSNVTEMAFIYFSYGNFLASQIRYTDAAEAYRRGLDLSARHGNHIFTYRFYRELSALATLQGNSDEALHYFSLYHEEYNRIYSLEQERRVKGLTAHYSEAVHNQRIQKTQIELLRRKRNMIVISLLLFFAGTAAVSIYVMYRRKNRLYRRVATLYRESTDTQIRLRNEIERLRAGQKESPSIDEEKGDNLFHRLERLMSVEKAFTDSNLTRETVAECLGTNRTYLSQTVSKHTGENFTAYVNYFRINEALRLLADPTCDMPLKAIPAEVGFSSQTTFYKFFREKTGMTPAQYRQNVREGHNQTAPN